MGSDQYPFGEKGKNLPCHRHPTGSSWSGCSGRSTRCARAEGACGSSGPSAAPTGSRRWHRRRSGRWGHRWIEMLAIMNIGHRCRRVRPSGRRGGTNVLNRVSSGRSGTEDKNILEGDLPPESYITKRSTSAIESFLSCTNWPGSKLGGGVRHRRCVPVVSAACSFWWARSLMNSFLVAPEAKRR